MKVSIVRESDVNGFDATVRFTGIKPSDSEEKYDNIIRNAAKVARDRNEFNGKLKELLLEKTTGMPRWHLLAGLGDNNSSANYGLMASLSIEKVRNEGAKSIAFIADDAHDNELYNIIIGSLLKTYSFNKYKTVGLEDIKSLSKIGIISDNPNADSILAKALIVSDSVNMVRDLQNTPSNELTPKIFAGIAKEVSDEINAEYSSISGNDLVRQGYTAIASVGQGSVNEPYLVTIEYKPPKYSNTVALVGKGITFDTGGISIKPSERMGDMKYDMSGASSVLGAIRAAALLHIPVRIVCVLCLAENMPSSNSYKPGDIVRTKSGKTIEIDNTDAEGRVVLSDGLYHATTYNPDTIVDLATLTGAAVVALGDIAAPILGNNQSIISSLLFASDRTGEKLWQLPLWDDYKDDVSSKVADIKNTGTNRMAGTIAGAMLLKEFVNDVPWAHVDIAGVANMKDRERYYTSYGGTGFGVRLLVDYIENVNKE
ncbi:MAG: leucyl aminopeptidase [Candidatus Woesearchaeota archaeon]